MTKLLIASGSAGSALSGMALIIMSLQSYSHASSAPDNVLPSLWLAAIITALLGAGFIYLATRLGRKLRHAD